MLLPQATGLLDITPHAAAAAAAAALCICPVISTFCSGTSAVGIKGCWLKCSKGCWLDEWQGCSLHQGLLARISSCVARLLLLQFHRLLPRSCHAQRGAALPAETGPSGCIYTTITLTSSSSASTLSTSSRNPALLTSSTVNCGGHTQALSTWQHSHFQPGGPCTAAAISAGPRLSRKVLPPSAALLL